MLMIPSKTPASYRPRAISATPAAMASMATPRSPRCFNASIVVPAASATWSFDTSASKAESPITPVSMISVPCPRRSISSLTKANSSPWCRARRRWQWFSAWTFLSIRYSTDGKIPRGSMYQVTGARIYCTHFCIMRLDVKSQQSLRSDEPRTPGKLMSRDGKTIYFDVRGWIKPVVCRFQI